MPSIPPALAAQVASSLATCVEGLARGHQQMKALLVQQENTQRELKACRDELRSFTDKKNPASSASAASSQRDDNKLHEVRSRCITLELTNQKLWDINKGLEKDRVAMVKEIAQVRTTYSVPNSTPAPGGARVSGGVCALLGCRAPPGTSPAAAPAAAPPTTAYIYRRSALLVAATQKNQPFAWSSSSMEDVST
jgi:hypothetical protein